MQCAAHRQQLLLCVVILLPEAIHLRLRVHQISLELALLLLQLHTAGDKCCQGWCQSLGQQEMQWNLCALTLVCCRRRREMSGTRAHTSTMHRARMVVMTGQPSVTAKHVVSHVTCAAYLCQVGHQLLLLCLLGSHPGRQLHGWHCWLLHTAGQHAAQQGTGTHPRMRIIGFIHNVREVCSLCQGTEA